MHKELTDRGEEDLFMYHLYTIISNSVDSYRTLNDSNAKCWKAICWDDDLYDGTPE